MKQLMKKIWNTIRYGDKKLAGYTLLIILLFAGAAVLFASAYTHSAIAHAIIAIAMIGMDLYLISRLADEEMEEPEKSEPQSVLQEMDTEEAAENIEKVPEERRSFRLGDIEDFAPEKELSEHSVEELTEDEEKERTSFTFSGFLEKLRHSFEKKAVSKKEPKKKKPKGFKKVKAVFPAADGSKEQITMFLKSYKVKQNHITVLIDNSRKYNIKECPAYLWKDKRGIHLLLLEETTREIVLPASSVTAIIHKRAVPGNPRKEYLDLREPSLKSAIFSSYIPEYYNAGSSGAFSGFQQAKNLYQIAPDIQFSEKCAKEIMDLLNLNFVVYDQYTKSDKFSEYFKAGHRYQVLLRDKVIEPEEYREKIQNLLKRMLVANIHEDVFDDTIRQMVMYNMIGSDNGEYYRAQRAKIISQKEMNDKKGKKRKR